ncbi:MAG: DNA polymerase III subunit delta [Fervidobacterium sp.]|uniref:DNA polymerase III subunit delta n=1 Tax=Fervidobacterium TaxID=2422 RepID=UPI0021FB284F|nr:DNA polymerase III subunit delta [Fervidobacterium riparium]
MVIYLTGDSELKKEFYVKNYISGKDIHYRRIYADDTDKISELKYASQSVGLFSNSKVYDLVDFDEWSKSEKNEFMNISFSNEQVTVFVRTQKVSKDIEGGQVVVLEKPKDWEEEKWIELILQTAKELNIICNKEVAQEIYNLVGSDEFGILTELEKLKTYSNDEVSIEDVDEIVYKRTISRLDEFLFAISERKYSKALELLNDIVSEYDAVVISYALAKHFIDLFDIIANLHRKQSEYSWPEISKLAKETEIASPKVARFLGFRFKNSKNPPFNHVLYYTAKSVLNLINRIYLLDRRVKLGDDIKVLLSELISELKQEKSEQSE